MVGVAQGVGGPGQPEVGGPAIMHQPAVASCPHGAAPVHPKVGPAGRADPMQPVQAALCPQSRFVQMLDRGLLPHPPRQVGPAGLPRLGRAPLQGHHRAYRQCGAAHLLPQRGEAGQGQQLHLMQIEHQSRQPPAVRHRRGHAARPRGARRPLAARTGHRVRPVLCHLQRRRGGQVEYLPRRIGGRGGRPRQRHPAVGPLRRVGAHHRVRCRHRPPRGTGLAGLTAHRAA